MKSIRFASGTLITSSAVVAALIDYVSRMSTTDNSVPVDIPVLETNGTIATHTVLVSSTVHFDVVDVDGDSGFADESAFPKPQMPPLAAMVAVTPPDTADDDAKNFDRAVADIDHLLDQL
jgi:hypothetical protein